MENKKYQVIYADPPWKFHNNIDKANVKRFKGQNITTGINANTRYPTMTSKQIAELPIKDLLHKDAACFMWTTDAHLAQAIEIMKSWGFTYKTIAFIWEKTYKTGTSVKMVAPWTLKGAEICLMGTKGAMKKYKKDNTIWQIVKAERTRHSAKPHEVANRIVRMFPDCNRIELFARDAKPGWDVWGNEVQSDIEL